MSLAVGIIGAGVMGAFHARLLREGTGHARLAAVCDTDPQRAAQAAEGARVHSDPLALIADPQVEAVVVASPDATHAPLALACLAAGKPVLLEKPIAATAAEGWRVLEAEAARGRRLVTVGYMRRFDAAYLEMKSVADTGDIGTPVLLHNVHRNPSAPDWFAGPMPITNSFVHEIDVSRWLLGSEMVAARVHAGPGGEPLLIALTTDRGELVSTEVNINARYGYHVHAELVCREGTISMAQPELTAVNSALRHASAYPDNWVPRFAQAYRDQMQAWVRSVSSGIPVGASAWDGYCATAVAEQVAQGLDGCEVQVTLPPIPALYEAAR
ncbi:Gfo/Idh/MocA family oxidoreductase [Rubellimicrobium aerolatum]|uniref:Gfo/Idh/MocA family oxidoreductase n=1 Tax=Rubellimicrobium aerolatum TaxID=490979 RepID=A0ABW0SD49_9RHOB|nr:Gfo/Idh/MocA family oxidoreductase [Rubellimicrobium aerolatum]MBP1806687.1 myo-inositol 2-dehydrogenase/D-chiro-inositol 1-dehydrogenase [Rubellimicrobium aerolatum]